MLSKTNIKIMNAFHPWDGGYNSELQKFRLMLYKTNNEIFSFVRWYSYFHSVKDEMFYSTRLCLVDRTFHLSPHENICTIALITIHYLYNIALFYNSNSKYFIRISIKLDS